MDVGIADLVKSVTKLVERAEHGEDITITRHGKPVSDVDAAAATTAQA